MKIHVITLGHPLVAPCTATTVPCSADDWQCCVCQGQEAHSSLSCSPSHRALQHLRAFGELPDKRNLAHPATGDFSL